MSQMNRIPKIILIALFSILISAIHVSADQKKEHGRNPGMHRGPYGGPGFDVNANLSDEEIQKLDEARTAFFEATRDLRRHIYQKRLALLSELSKENPSAEIAKALQQEISDLKAQLAQKRLDHILAIREINPDLGWRFGPDGYKRHHREFFDRPSGGYGAGFGMGPGMMGPGGGGYHNYPGGGPCGGYPMGPGMMGPGGGDYYNYPGGGPCGGYHGGPGMMGPGMMGHYRGYPMGSGYGRGPGMMGPGMVGGWSGRDCPRQYDQEQGSGQE